MAWVEGSLESSTNSIVLQIQEKFGDTLIVTF